MIIILRINYINYPFRIQMTFVPGYFCDRSYKQIAAEFLKIETVHSGYLLHNSLIQYLSHLIPLSTILRIIRYRRIPLNSVCKMTHRIFLTFLPSCKPELVFRVYKMTDEQTLILLYR